MQIFAMAEDITSVNIKNMHRFQEIKILTKQTVHSLTDIKLWKNRITHVYFMSILSI